MIQSYTIMRKQISQQNSNMNTLQNKLHFEMIIAILPLVN